MDSIADIDSWSWKITEFPKIWPLTCHKWVKYWRRTKNDTTDREYSVRAICWSFLRNPTALRLETPRRNAKVALTVRAKMAKHRIRARVNTLQKRHCLVRLQDKANTCCLCGGQWSHDFANIFLILNRTGIFRSWRFNDLTSISC